MLLAHLKYPETYKPWLTHPTWQTVLKWLEELPANLPDGEHAIQGRDIYVNAHSPMTGDRSTGTYEAHRDYLDLHFVRSGGELIEWAPVGSMQPTMEYDKEKDYQLFATPAKAVSLMMIPGSFAIFMPEDAHMPKISDGINDQVRKVVVKVKLSLLQ
jgi:biofilm protein TabA